jgi:hypothetical protein
LSITILGFTFNMRSTDYVAAAVALFGSALAAPTTYTANTTSPACIPQLDPNPEARAAAVSTRSDGFIYGPSLTGEAAPFPNGTLGNARTKADYDTWSLDRTVIDNLIALDVQSLQGAIQAVTATPSSYWKMELNTNFSFRMAASTVGKTMKGFSTMASSTTQTLEVPLPVSLPMRPKISFSPWNA